MSVAKGLNANQLKLIAIIAMTIDHIAWAVFPGFLNNPIVMLMHIFGRITCPVMCFFIAEGYHHTRNINKYTARLFLFAFISHFAYIFASNSFCSWKSFIPFYYGFFLNQTSVMWPLAWGLVMLRINDSRRFKNPWIKLFLMALICLIAFPADWSCVASLCVFAIGTNKGDFKKQMLWMVFFVFTYSVVYFFAISKLYAVVQMCVVLSIPFLKMYNGERGANPKLNRLLKWIFYIYYPLHLTILGIIKQFM